jgi:hypothetical protein
MMAFIRRKQTSAGRTVYQVVRSEQQGGKVRQRVLISLCYVPTIADAIAEQERCIALEERLPDWNLAYKRQQIQRHRTAIAELERVRQETGLV